MKLPDLISIIASLDTSKSTGLDSITPKILKASADIICPTLFKIINVSISSGIFPDCLKQAKIIPIYKGGPQNDPSNYRPISILSILSKIIEKHIAKHLFGYMNKYSLLHKSQSGFRKNHSCNTALINIIDKWLSEIDRGEVIGAVFFDLRKAFDIVDHDLLLQKLAVYKFKDSALSWIRSYLYNRKQCITDKTDRSSFQNVHSGVPQGSVLGPVLFLLFVNDMPLFIHDAYIDIYADDTTLHTASKDSKTVENNLQIGTDNFKTWCLSNKMFINIEKTSVMTIGTRQ
ncbi:MAG: reverse transcriptase family protein [Candidatus Thiodiazotropha taylori]|nr:reverse transcriptase family protein [Candidatus Thiodiazotropha taylori]